MSSIWTIKYSTKAQKALNRITRVDKQRILDFLAKRVSLATNPRSLSKSLQGEWEGYSRFRVGDYRIICDIQDEIITILVIEIGHRASIYR